MHPDSTSSVTTPLIDAHHHIWRRADLSWLDGPEQPRIFGSYGPIRRDYLIDEYLTDARSAGVERSVYVQTNWPEGQELREVEWIAQTHAETGWPHAMVSYADMTRPDLAAYITQALDVFPLIRGMRMQLHWHENPQLRFAPAPDLIDDPQVDRNLGVLEAHGLMFDLQVFPSQMATAARVVARHPGLTFVLVHAGMLESLAEEHVAPWRAGLELLAAQPNVVVKLSGQGTFVHQLDPALIGLVTRTVIELFGPERSIWGSNFPVEKLWCDYTDLASTWESAVDEVAPADRDAIFGGTARRLFCLD